METKIDKAHDYTHEPHFEEDFQNDEIRKLLRMVMDIAQGLSNIHSNTRRRGLFSFDRRKYIKRFEELKEILERMPSVEELEGDCVE